MAYYAALVSLVQLLKEITQHDRYSNSFLDKHQLHIFLYAKFNLLQEMLDDYSDHKEESNDILKSQIRDVAYRAQDIIESHISHQIPTADSHIQDIIESHISHQIPTKDKPRPVKGISLLCVSAFKKVYRKFQPQRFEEPPRPDNIVDKEYYQDLEKVKTEVDSVLEELIRIKAESNIVHEDLQPNSCISVESSRVQAPRGKNTMLVFHENLRTTIKAQLCGQSSKLEVISIAGMGGLGKTTLARIVFDDRLIYDRFDCCAWVTISQDYHLKTILLAIVNSLNIDKLNGEEVLQQHIYKNLFGMRYLIVMDDVWETRFWDDIKRIFPDNSNGSRIMITTRLSDVADCASRSDFHHQMQFLDENQSWTLLRGKVFATQEDFPKELEVSGKLIAKNCRGLPLAIVVIAGVLANVKRGQHNWENIARKVSSITIDQSDEHVSAILSLSYNHLPHHLKPCFLHLGGFSEDYEIRISELIRLWVAEGFLKPIESKSLEEVGEEYLKDLAKSNLVLITKKKFNGKFKFCMIHDVLRDLCSQRARDENFTYCVQHKDDFKRVPIMDVRRVCIPLNGYSEICKYIMKHGSHVRSLIINSPKPRYSDEPLSVASGCKLLRILDTKTIIHSTTYHKLAELLHLRYLNLHSHRFVTVPPLLFFFQNLQTLILESGASLPPEIWKMSQLRHVICKRGVELLPIPYDEIRIIGGVPPLGSLQTLSIVINFRFTGDNIEMIPNLKKLGFECFSKGEQYWEEYGLNNLVHLHQLETLYIEFHYFQRNTIVPLPKNFAFPSTLIKLTLVGCRLPWKDMSVVGSLPNLQVLKLRTHAFLGEEWEPIEGEFLKLKFLLLENLPDLKYWRAENTHFPRLEHLHIRYCYSLEEIPPGIGDIPTLQLIKLELGYYSNSALEPSALKIQEQQRDLGNDDLQFHFLMGDTMI